MEQKGENYTGGCLCGAVAFEVSGAPLWVAHCHCHSCRRNTGSVYATFVGLSEDQFSIRKGEPGEFVSSAGVSRGFCDGCGTPLTYRSDRFAGEVHVYVSTFDRPDAFPPQLHVHVGEAIPWTHLDDGLPRYQTTSRDGAPMQ